MINYNLIESWEATKEQLETIKYATHAKAKELLAGGKLTKEQVQKLLDEHEIDYVEGIQQCNENISRFGGYVDDDGCDGCGDSKAPKGSFGIIKWVALLALLYIIHPIFL